MKYLTAYVQCQYHLGGAADCRAVQLSHDTRYEKNWQSPIWCCADCRRHLLGQFRYAGLEHRVRQPVPVPTIERIG